MKKSIIFVCLAFLLTGCSTTITYDFEKEVIKSNIEIELNNSDLDKMTTDLKFEDGKISNYEAYIKDMINSAAILATNNKEYNSKGYTKNNDNYKIDYSYDFSYSDFENNYYIKDCFDYYIHTEDENFYYYQIYGNNNCDYENLKLLVKGNVVKSNSNNIKHGIHSFEILKKDNNIEFTISKKDIANKSAISKWKIIAGVVLSILIIITVFLMKKVNE